MEERRLISRNVSIKGKRTSLRLEQEIWDALGDICQRESMTLHELCTLVDQRRNGTSRTAAVRAFIVTYFRAMAHHAEIRIGQYLSRPNPFSALFDPSSQPSVASVAFELRTLVDTDGYRGADRRDLNDITYSGPNRRLN